MSTFNDTESLTTLSEMNSVCGDYSFNKDKKIALMEEKIRQLEASKLVQLVLPSWIVKETEAVKQCLDEFRVAFNEAKQRLLEKRGNEDISEDNEENKKAAQLTEEVKSIWMSAAKDVKKHLGGITAKLNGCCGNKVAGKLFNDKKIDKDVQGVLRMNLRLPNLDASQFQSRGVKRHLSGLTNKLNISGLQWKYTVEKPKTVKKVEQQLWMDVDLSGIPADQLPVINPNDVVPVIDDETIKISKKLVGAWKSDSATHSRPDGCYVPRNLVISYHNSGFFVCQRRDREPLYFRADGKRCKIKVANWDRQCTINDDQILCRLFLFNMITQDHLFRLVGENRIEYTFRNSAPCSYDGTYSYIREFNYA